MIYLTLYFKILNYVNIDNINFEFIYFQNKKNEHLNIFSVYNIIQVPNNLRYYTFLLILSTLFDKH